MWIYIRLLKNVYSLILPKYLKPLFGDTSDCQKKSQWTATFLNKEDVKFVYMFL